MRANRTNQLTLTQAEKEFTDGIALRKQVREKQAQKTRRDHMRQAAVSQDKLPQAIGVSDENINTVLPAGRVQQC